MWTRANRGLYEHKGARYPSDLSDAEWTLIAPMIPPAKRDGRRREVDLCEVLNGVLYVLETGCQWRTLPNDLPPKSTVHDYLMLWDWDGMLERIHYALYLMTRDLEGCEAAPRDQRTKSAYIFGAICPARGAVLALPRCNTQAMQWHLEEISSQIAPGAHGVLIPDQASWHTTKKLAVPENFTLLRLPPRSPEQNPVENIWQSSWQFLFFGL